MMYQVADSLKSPQLMLAHSTTKQQATYKSRHLNLHSKSLKLKKCTTFDTTYQLNASKMKGRLNPRPPKDQTSSTLNCSKPLDPCAGRHNTTRLGLFPATS